MALYERKVAGAVIVMTVFLKLLMLPLMYTCSPVLGDYAVLLYFVPDGAVIGLFWVPFMTNYARRIHMDYAPVTGAIASLYTLTVLNAVTVPLFLYYAPACVTLSSLLCSTASLAVADLVLASLLLPVRSYMLRLTH